MIVNKETTKHKFIILVKNNLNIKFSLTNIYKNQKDFNIRIDEKSHIYFVIFRIFQKIQEKIFNIYKKWKHLFLKEKIGVFLLIYNIVTQN